MCKTLYITVLCCGIAYSDAMNGIANDLADIETICGRLQTVADSSKSEAPVQQEYKSLGELYRRVEGTPQFEKWCDEHPIYSMLLSGLSWLSE